MLCVHMTSSPQTPDPIRPDPNHPALTGMGGVDDLLGHDTYGILLAVEALLQEARYRCMRVNQQAGERGSGYSIRVDDLTEALGKVEAVAATL